ncbi:MAG: homogentisate phytyltransferase, partial [Solirubrobacterales bacterium]|nr:homogentisate phytyltransferase [Solirubrobacterales bacterium]
RGAGLAPLRWAIVLWRFGRPHTLIGTFVSVVSLYLVAVTVLPGHAVGDRPGDLLATLVAALCVNVFIVGVNQLTDVEIDRINKPYLPIAAGALSPAGGLAIVVVAGIAPLVMALTQGALETGAVLAGLAVGAAYSLPPVRLKRFPTPASLSISLVRGIVVNLGVYLHFSLTLTGEASIAAAVWALTLFVVPFSFAIAILKDVPDIEGDRRYAIATFSVRLGPEPVVRVALAALTVSYLAMAAIGPFVLDELSAPVLVAAHLGALALLWRSRARTDVSSVASFTAFYMVVWKLFFLEYAAVALAALAG